MEQEDERMSGIYIPNEKIPENGFLQLFIYDNGDVQTPLYGFVGKAINVHDHGRLIDADALRASYPPCFTLDEIVRAFKNAPTIIPADKEEGE